MNRALLVAMLFSIGAHAQTYKGAGGLNSGGAAASVITTMSGSSVTCAAGVGTSALTLNLSCPVAGGTVIAPVVNSDIDGCNITVAETSALLGCHAIVNLVSSAGGTITLASVSNVVTVMQSWTPAVGDLLFLDYEDLANDKWQELARNAPAVFTSTLNGITPLSGGGTANYLRADGTWAAPPGTASGANTALSNLASVAINTSLISDSNDVDDLGSDALRWADLYLGPSTLHVGTAVGDEGSFSYDTGTNITALDSTGAMTLLGGSGSSGCTVGTAGSLTCTDALSMGAGTFAVGATGQITKIANVAYTSWPADDGDNGECLGTNGSGVLDWTTCGGASGIAGTIAITQLAVGSGVNTVGGSAELTYASGGLSEAFSQNGDTYFIAANATNGTGAAASIGVENTGSNSADLYAWSPLYANGAVGSGAFLGGNAGIITSGTNRATEKLIFGTRGNGSIANVEIHASTDVLSATTERADVDLRIETDTNANAFVLDAGAETLKSGLVTTIAPVTGTAINLDIQTLNTGQASGVFNIAYPSGVTQGAALTGSKINLATNLTRGAFSATGENIQIAGYAATATSENTTGLNIGFSGASQATSGTQKYWGSFATMPDITQTAGTLTSTGFEVLGGNITTGGTQTGFRYDNANTLGAGTQVALDIDSITGGAGTETAISVGSGWDKDFAFTGGGTIGSTTTLTPATNVDGLELIGTNVTSGKLLDVQSKNVSGIIASILYPSATTQTGSIDGINVDMRTNFTPIATAATTRGLVLTLDGGSTDGTILTQGIYIDGGVSMTTTAGTTTWQGIAMDMPVSTQTGGTFTSTGLQISDNGATTGGTYRGINMTMAGATAGVTKAGLDVSAVTNSTGTDYGVRIGTGHDFDFGGAQYTTGTMSSLRVTTGRGNTVPTKPACAASTDEGGIVYLKDLDGSATAQLCICGLWAADATTYSWQNILAASGTACTI